MENFYMIKWGFDFNDNYNYGANISLLENDSIRFSSPFMPTGTPIKTWYSRTEFHSARKSPMLPILMNGKGYNIQVQAEFDTSDAAQLVIEFFNVNNDVIEKIHFKELDGHFIFPEEAISYNVQLVNKKHEFIIFKYLTIFSDSLKERYEVKTNKSTEAIFLKVRHPYEGIKTNIVVQKKAKYMTSLVIEDYMNYYFLIGDQSEKAWLEAITYLCTDLQNNQEVHHSLSIERGIRFDTLEDKFKLVPYVLESLVPSCKGTNVGQKKTTGWKNLKDRVQINEQVIQILQQLVKKQKSLNVNRISNEQ
ncbi:accessory Sec system protein Asp3 [Enterococcus avium]|uniref:accessory Sec system protein Asp3 n=1 Tax=Enterococcus avium TaxID=33945 RepID=UPI00288FE7D0|nr:accessory Sec system protein Asp3 [Enterococcus avium]MDT2459138.1 accessory Sec system protein Asp3 [Enterococcus avium]